MWVAPVTRASTDSRVLAGGSVQCSTGETIAMCSASITNWKAFENSMLLLLLSPIAKEVDVSKQLTV